MWQRYHVNDFEWSKVTGKVLYVQSVHLTSYFINKKTFFHFFSSLIQTPGQSPGDHRSSAASGDQSLGPDWGQT